MRIQFRGDACASGWRPGALVTSGARSFAWLLRLMTLLSIAAGTATAKDVPYRVEIDAPAPLKSLVETNLTLEHQKSADGKEGFVDDDQLRRLFEQGRDEIGRLVATEGYYSPTIDADLVQDGDRWVARYRIVPNAITTVGAVDISFVGPIADAPAGELPDIDALRNAWGLKKGDVFRQTDWEANKRRTLQALLLQTYPFATITRSEAKVDVRDDSASLSLVIASGPAVRFGPLQVTGLGRYPASVVNNLNPIKIGDLYSQTQVFELQRRLNSSGFFSRVDVSIDTTADPGTDPREPAAKPADGAEPATPATEHAPATPVPREVTLPIRISVAENKSQAVSLGLGYSTNSGARATASYNIVNFLGGAKQLRTTLQFDQLTQALSADLLFPTAENGDRDSISSSVKREEVQNEITRGVTLSGWRTWGPERTEQYTSLDYIFERKSIDGVPQVDAQVVGATYGITLRRTDNLLTPTSGYLATAQVGPGFRIPSGQPYARAYGKILRFQPVTENNSLVLRLEAGAIAGRNTDTIPSSLLFRAGGDGSVRGYGYQSLGVPLLDAIVGGRYLATGTVEGIHWLGPKLPGWGVALFVDAGNAGNTLAALRPVYGYGTGVRWRSPVGTLDFDVARGVENGTIRLHFSLGVQF